MPSFRHFLPHAYSLLPSLFLLLSASCLLAPALGQSATATLSGTVEDQNRAVVPGADITLQNVGTSLERNATTNDSGSFSISLLSPGTYTIRVTRVGFTPLEIRDVVLNVGDQKALQIQLKAGNVNATVEVTSEASLISESPAVATVVDRQFVGNLPLNGRSFQSLIALTPGAVFTKTSSSNVGQFSVNGQRANANYFTVDGVSANIAASSISIIGEAAAGAVPGLTASGGTNNLVSVDALEEFKIQTSSYAPEFGRSPGAQVSLVTRSGTNDFHGSVFEYFRNEALDANDWFANSRGLKRPPLRQHQFGGTFSGPVLLPRFGEGGRQPWYSGRDRTFFFFSYEGLRLKQPIVGIVNVPSLEVRQLAPPRMLPYLDAFPRPTGPTRANGSAEFAASYSDPTTLNATSIRMDHILNTKLTVFARYNHAPSDTIRRQGPLNTVNTQYVNTQTATIGATFTLGPSVSNELRANYSYVSAGFTLHLDEFGGSVVPPDSVLFPQGFSSENSSFAFNLVGEVTTTFAVGRNTDQLQRQVNLVDHLSVVRGPHQLKFGVDYRRLMPRFARNAYNQEPIFNGIGLTAPGIAPPVGSLLSGRVAGGSRIEAHSQPREPIYTNLSVYAQDTWRTSRRLTLTYGLRWELNTPPREANGSEPFTVIGIDDLRTVKLGPRGRLYETTYGNFAPRFGVAWQLSQAQGRETMFRAGVGLFYDLGQGNLAFAYRNFPFITTKSVPAGTIFPLESTLAAPPPISLVPRDVQLTVADPDLALPLIYQWNLSAEQSLGTAQRVTASYVAALGRRLLRRENHVLTAGTNPNFFGNSSINVTKNAATSDYHALQLQYQRRLSRRLQALASYTWAKSLDIASNDSSFLPPEFRYDPRQDRGPSDFDVRHAFNAAVTYDLPRLTSGRIWRELFGGWSLDTIITARTATPVDVFSSRNIGFGSFLFRPDLIAGVPLYINQGMPPGGRRFNRAAFSIPAALRQGTLGRNMLRGFPISQLDLSFRRLFAFSEGCKLQLRVEAFNLFNHPNFGDPQGNLTSSTFGLSTAMLGRSLGPGGGLGGLNPIYQIGGPRSMQLSIKVLF